MRVFADSIAVRQITGDSITAGTVADARIATTLCRDTEASGLAHDTLWANTPGFATKANVHDSLFANTPGFLLKSLFKDSVVATGAKIPKAALADSAVKYDTATSLQWAEGRTIAHDTLWGNSPLFFRTAGNGLTSSSATVNIVGSDEITVAADSIYVADSKIKSVHLEDGTIVTADIATGGVATGNILDATIAKADLGTDLNRKIVPLKYIASQDHALEDNIILSLEGFDKADSSFYMFRDSSAAAGSDTIMLGCTLPSNITQADTLILIYKSSSGTTSTSKIDEVMLWVTSGQGVTLRTRDFSDATDKASSSRAKITYSLSTDGDFNEEEQVTLRIITAYGSASQFVKLYQAYLICR